MTRARDAVSLLHRLVLTDGAAVRYGRHFDGSGPGRHGWYYESAAGECRGLGTSAAEIVEQADHPLPGRGLPGAVVSAIFAAQAEVSR